MSPKSVAVSLVLIGILGASAWSLRNTTEEIPPARAWGNVDTRQVSLAFEASGRIASLALEEGEFVKKGDVIGRLDTEALEISRAQAAAQLKVYEARASMAAEGYRKEDIEVARRNVESLEAQLQSAVRTYKRQQSLNSANATTKQLLEDAKYQADSLDRQLAASKATLSMYEAGLRPQEVTSAEAQAEAARAELAALDYQIEKASILRSPTDGIIRGRLAEPGDMVTAAKTVYQISISSPKWVRCFITEKQLGYVKEGIKAKITTDTVGQVEGRVSFISDTAEFSPKTVQTEDLRTVLVYEVRLNVNDPQNILRLGQPVTVDFAQTTE